ncbi:daunorubicin resistance protein DrrA family ABC transporter ATP-binding protein [Solirubrobacter soli]|uniref:daunorubicin resistance protein DrrA family ABC transporter ATP-binding protein n=1 Tax=Solirubrobacter soli TaxID=363832 RepID=UPI000486FA84|nr:daunorubicin resistance protein DrrA family ABC transporter ATP-binding protein [Solirubrobacter soli]
MAYGVEASDLSKRFGDVAALDGLSLVVPAGRVCGLLGPNGAGKTTAVRVLTTLLRMDAGRAVVAGCDVARDPVGVRRRIGLVGQHAAVDEVLSGRQNLVLFGRLFHLGVRRARARADELLSQFGLTDARDRPVSSYSGGMRRRLDLAAGLILSPPVLFLDEPTTGLDPRGRGEVWAAVRALVSEGTTVVLTTQMLEEADQLSDVVTVIDRGRVIASDTPAALKASVRADWIEVVVRDAVSLERARAVLGAGAEVDVDARRVSAPVRDRIATLGAVVRELGDDAEDVTLRRPTLDEVFLELTAPPSPRAAASERPA